MKQYAEIISEVLARGSKKGDRTGTGVVSTFNVNKTFNLQDGFPIVTGKFVPFKAVAAELLWFLSGSTNNEDLRAFNGNNNSTIWEEWADEEGELGPIYGKQWLDFGGKPRPNDSNMTPLWDDGVDQIQNVIDILKTNPESRRMVVSAWNPAELEDMALEPCHYAFELYTEEAGIVDRVRWAMNNGLRGKIKMVEGIAENHTFLTRLGVPELLLSCKVIQRSCDVFLGVPFNIASYALLTHLIAHCVDMLPGDLHWSGGNTHIYNNHMEQVATYMDRPHQQLPELVVYDSCPKDINKINLDHFGLVGYTYGESIKAEVSV